MTLADHLSNNSSPKRILALDGGGIRGALSLGYLQRIEDILKKQNGNNTDFRLCNYFDLIGGTSTGSIIASCLAIGMKVQDIKEMYMDLGDKIFGKKYKWWKIFEIDDLLKATYKAKPLEDELQKLFGAITLESDKIKTGLCIIAKRADTNSVWPLINHPGGKYFNSADGLNKDIPLWKAVRASAAAPTYFLPQVIDVGGGLHEAAFVDGGVSMANNPALQLLMVATLQGFPFKWKCGANNLLIVSVGTGMSRWKQIPADVKKNNLLNWAKQLPDMFMQDASWHNQIIMQWLSNSPTAWPIDGEIGKLENDCISGSKKDGGLMSYLRYNLWLDAETLKPLMKKAYSQREIDGLTEMSNAASRFELYDIGVKAAFAEVKENHFADTFKL
ncbi:patatin-like phospholipase family protein [Agriterribacter sp.]|uniref:patatin-like phospholipase family protein n=1 Tax=Agriterribacter sp. TaxID=2821509 RepID=UPI002C4C0ADB|nr:patatin-like phospholipase family protein [Agriterribacter sp.]HTN05529.1 patatin-like phospholipase family protein [Agriterribacter sp.]